MRETGNITCCFGQTGIVTFTVLGHFGSSYKVIFGHLYLVMLKIICDNDQVKCKTKFETKPLTNKPDPFFIGVRMKSQIFAEDT